MRIAIFTHNYPKDKYDRKDAGIFIHDFAEELKKKHEIFIFCPDYGNNKKFGNWSIFNPLSAIIFFKNIYFGINKALKFVNKNKVDYILCAWAIPSGIYGLASKIKYKVPYGIWYLGSDINIYSKYPILSTIIYYLSTKADNLFANSYALAKVANQKYKNCSMLPASTNVKSDNRNTKKIKLSSRKTRILFVGRLEKIKGPDLLVEASKRLNDKFEINVIGDGTMRDQISKSGKNINFLGYMGISEISSYMKSSDFLIITSRNESLPLVILEAANYNLPVLSSDVGDCKYVLNKYKIGNTFRTNDVGDITNKIHKFNFAKFKKLGRYADLVSDYSLHASTKRFLEIINK